MQSNSKKSLLSLALGVGLLASATWSTSSHACAADSPYIGSICTMAWAKASSFGNAYISANGAELNVSQYQALFAVIGYTYGGNGSTTFKVPDLRGRVIIGAGVAPFNGVSYVYGVTGGSPSVALSLANLPAHNHAVSSASGGGLTVTTGVTGMTAATTLTGLTATTSLAGVTAATSLSGVSVNTTNNLTLNANNTGTQNSPDPAGRSIAKTGLTSTYSNTAPNVAMASGSIGGNVTASLVGTPTTTLSGNPTTTITGNPTTTLSGGPSVAISGATGVTGASAAVSIMQPYMPLSYYIAWGGIFPTVD